MIPNLFSKEPIPAELPKDMDDLAQDLADAKSKDVALRKAYDVITHRFSAGRFMSVLLFWKAIQHDPMKLWHRQGFLHAHQQNYLLRIVLVKSGHFSDEDIELRLTNIWLLPHQYLRVHTDEQTYVDIDPWARSRNILYGQSASGFV